jgi:ankyrin repeat protein
LSPPVDLIKAIRTGLVSEVVAALDAGAQVELNDGKGDPGLPLAMACFMGHAEIVRELALRGARVNLADNRDARSPLAMALRAGKTEVVKVLIELGADIPPGMPTGLNDQELMLARWKAQHFGASQSGGQQSDGNRPVIEEINMVGCYGTDTDVLNDEMRRAVQEMCKKK